MSHVVRGFIVTDIFVFVRNFVVFEVVRKDEFAPLKNADGAASDTPTSVRTSLMDQHRRWVSAAGASLLDGDGNKIGPETRWSFIVLRFTSVT